MTVYVDEARYPFGRMLMCHMLADTPDELHAMADRIGVKRKWFQRKASAPHYDICKSKRALAVARSGRGHRAERARGDHPSGPPSIQRRYRELQEAEREQRHRAASSALIAILAR